MQVTKMGLLWLAAEVTWLDKVENEQIRGSLGIRDNRQKSKGVQTEKVRTCRPEESTRLRKNEKGKTKVHMRRNNDRGHKEIRLRERYGQGQERMTSKDCETRSCLQRKKGWKMMIW